MATMAKKWQRWRARRRAGGLTGLVLVLALAIGGACASASPPVGSPSEASSATLSPVEVEAPLASAPIAPVEIRSLELKEGAPGSLIEMGISDAVVWTSYRDSADDLVLEFANSRPVDTVGSVSMPGGLVDSVAVEVEEGDRPVTRLVIGTRSEAEHSVSADGSLVRVELIPVDPTWSGGATYPTAVVALEEGPLSSPVEAPMEPHAEPVVYSAETPDPGNPDPVIAGTDSVPAPQPAYLGNPATRLAYVDVAMEGDATVVRIRGDGEFYYTTFTLEAPERFVVDLIGVVNGSAERSISVGSQLVDRVRIAQFKPRPELVSRVVVDLNRKSTATVEATAEGIEVRFTAADESSTLLEDLSENGLDQVARAQTPVEEPMAREPEVVAATTEREESSAGDITPTQVEPVPLERSEYEAEGMGASENGAVGPNDPSTVTLAQVDAPEPVAAVEAESTENEVTFMEPGADEAPAAPVTEPAPVEAEPEYAPPPPMPELPQAEAPVEEPVYAEPVRTAPAVEEPVTEEDLFAPSEVAPGPIIQQKEGGSPSFASRTLSGGEKVYRGEPMTLSLKNGEIKDVLRSFAQISGLNVVVQPQVSGTVTVELTNVPWDQALEQILKINGLGYELEGNIMRVAPLAQLRAEAEEEQRLLAAQALSIPLDTVMKRVSYSDANQVASLLRQGGGASLMSQRGSVVVDTRTNTLIIKELPGYMDTLISVIENLDTPEPQVMIEARIVETTKRFSRSLGIEWDFQGVSDSAHGNTTGLVFPNNGTVEGGVSLLTGAANGFLDISLGNILNTFSLDATLQAAESEGLINILSAPRITTLNNERAEIQSGLQIPIQTVANNTVSVQFVNATLRLEVTPHVTAEGTVLMDIAIQKREPQLAFAVVGATNAPISTKDARTRVIVRDGGTTVIGGIYKVSSDQGEDRVPGLANVPILKYLFKNRRRLDENEELLIFITPRVVRL